MTTRHVLLMENNEQGVDKSKSGDITSHHIILSCFSPYFWNMQLVFGR